MAADFAKIQIEPFGCVITTIGELCIFPINWASHKEFRKALVKPINECDPTEFIRQYLPYICFPKTSLKEGKYRPDKPVLTDNEVSSLTNYDLDKIAELYIDNNPYLFKELISKTKMNDKGGTEIYHEYGVVGYPKNENETYTQYLLRLSIKKEEKLSEQLGKTLSSTIDIKSFSNELGESIKNTLSLGASLRKTMESIRPAEKPVMIKIEAESPKSIYQSWPA